MCGEGKVGQHVAFCVFYIKVPEIQASQPDQWTGDEMGNATTGTSEWKEETLGFLLRGLVGDISHCFVLGLVLLLLLQNKDEESIGSTWTSLTNVFIFDVQVGYSCYFIVYFPKAM